MAKKKADIENDKYWIEHGIDLKRRWITLDEEIGDVNTGVIIRAIDIMKEGDKVKPIDIFVNSYGGSVYDGLGLCDHIEELEEEGILVRTHVKGKIMSMALVIFIMGQERYASKRSTFMAHSLSSGTEGKVFEQKIDVKEAERLNDELLNILGEKTGKTRAFWAKEIEYKDKYFNKDQAIKLVCLTCILCCVPARICCWMPAYLPVCCVYVGSYVHGRAYMDVRVLHTWTCVCYIHGRRSRFLCHY